jgi:hypothetical protein
LGILQRPSAKRWKPCRVNERVVVRTNFSIDLRPSDRASPQKRKAFCGLDAFSPSRIYLRARLTDRRRSIWMWDRLEDSLWSAAVPSSRWIPLRDRYSNERVSSHCAIQRRLERLRLLRIWHCETDSRPIQSII